MFNTYNLTTYAFSLEDKILIDTNIWLYLYPATQSPKSQHSFMANAIKQYSEAFKKLLSAKVQIILDPLILSEYLNRYCRIEWEGGFQLQYPKFKNFRKSQDFKKIVTEANKCAKQILKICSVHSVSANSIDLSKALNIFEKGNLDFPDLLLVDICKSQNFKLMTHDSDFIYGDIEVLTVNPKLLNHR